MNGQREYTANQYTYCIDSIKVRSPKPKPGECQQTMTYTSNVSAKHRRVLIFWSFTALCQLCKVEQGNHLSEMNTPKNMIILIAMKIEKKPSESRTSDPRTLGEKGWIISNQIRLHNFTDSFRIVTLRKVSVHTFSSSYSYIPQCGTPYTKITPTGDVQSA